MSEIKLINTLDFSIEKEDVIVLEVEDGSQIKFRTVLLNIIETDKKNDSGVLYHFNVQNLVTTFSPEELRGEKGEKWPMSELEENITEPNMMFKRTGGDGTNIYSFEDKKLLVKVNINQIAKTSKYNKTGMPTYIVRSESTIAIAEEGSKIEEEE